MLSFSRNYLLIGSTLSAFSFWIAIAMLIPRKFYDITFFNVKKNKGYWISSILYLVFHILLYGIFYVMILGYIGFYPYVGYGIGATVTPPWPYFIYWEATSPGFWITIGPYESDTVPFTAFIGILLAMLIGANIEKIFELYKSIKNTRRISTAIVAIPSIGIISGTSCCLSLPSILIYLTALSIGAVSSVLGILASPLYFGLAYYGLPIGSIFLLLFNLRDMNRIISKCNIYNVKK